MLTLDISRDCHFLCAIDNSSWLKPDRTFALNAEDTLALSRPTNGDLRRPGVRGSPPRRVMMLFSRPVISCRCLRSRKTTRRDLLSRKYISKLRKSGFNYRLCNQEVKL